MSVHALAEPSPQPDTTDGARDFVARTARSVEALGNALGDSFEEAVGTLASARRIIVTGVGKSGLIGTKTAATLASTGSPAHFLHATEAAHGDLGIVTNEDAVLAISNSGESNELVPIVEYCRRFRVPLVAITAKTDSMLGRRASVVLPLPQEPEAGPLPAAPMTSTTLTLVLGDALACALIARKGFRQEDFHDFHPGGKLGAQTMRLSRLIESVRGKLPAGVPDPMRLVAVRGDTPIEEAAAAISEGGKGIVGVWGDADASDWIVGSLTDGDLRRALPRVMAGEVRTVAQIMHRDPVHLPDTALAAGALAVCEERRITNLFVTGDDGRPYAVVHVQDLLRAGAA